MKKIYPFVLFAVFCVIFWNLLDFVYTVWITGGAYRFSVFNDVCLPAVIGLTVGMFTNLRKK